MPKYWIFQTKIYKMNIDFQKSRYIWQKKRFNMDRLSFVWQKSFIRSLEIFYIIDNFNQNLKTSNKKNFLFKISTIRTKKCTDSRSLVFQRIQGPLYPTGGSKALPGANLIHKNYEYFLKRHWPRCPISGDMGRIPGDTSIPSRWCVSIQDNNKATLYPLASRSDANIRTKFFNQTYSLAKNLGFGLRTNTGTGIDIPIAKAGRAKKVPPTPNAMDQISKDWIFQSKGDAVPSIFYIKKREHYLQKSDQIFQNIWFQNYEKSNQNTYFYQRPISYPVQWIQKGDLLGDCAASTQGELALGKNLLVAYMPWEGFNFEDAVLINNKVLSTYTSLHIEKYDLEIAETSLEKITNHIPGIPKKNLLKLDKNGIVQIGSWVQEGDILVGKIIQIATETQTLLTHEKLLYDIVGQKDIQIQERCLRVPQGSSGRIIRISYTYSKMEQNRKNSFHQSLSESSLTKFKTTGPASRSDAVINKVKQNLSSGASYPGAWGLHRKAMPEFSQPSRTGYKVSKVSVGYPRSFFPFFVQNLQYSYFMRKSFRHFCQSSLGLTSILNLSLYRTGSNDRITVFEKMYTSWQGLPKLPNAHREALPTTGNWTGQANKGKASHRPGNPDLDNTGTMGFNIFSYMKKNKKFVTVVSRWLWLYKSLVTKNNYLFIGVGRFTRGMGQFVDELYKTSIAHGIPWDDNKGEMNNRARRIFNKKFCFNGSIKYICPMKLDPWVYQPQMAGPGLKPTINKLPAHLRWARGNRETHSDHFVDKTTGSFFSTTKSLRFTSIAPRCQPARLVKALVHVFPGEKKTGFFNQNLTAHRQTQPGLIGPVIHRAARARLVSRGIPGYKNFISLNQRNFQKVVFEKPNEPIQIPKIIPPISTRLDGKINCLQTFQKNQNRLRHQSQTKLLRTKKFNLKNIWNFSDFCQNVTQLHPNPIGPSLPLKAFKKITIYIAEKREFQVGDKISGRHGNKGIISQIFSNYDMPYLVSGDTLDVLLNPLGVPSRMNVGQILECLLGFTGQIFHTKFQILCFDEIYGYEASRSFIYSKIFELCQKMRQKRLFSKKTPGKLNIFDGRNGQLLHQSVMVGSTYLMKLIHIVDEKIHARGTGPYSLITQQPLRGRSKHGGQRFGEMEVWALQGFGSAYTLQELLTVKSDDLQGRNQIMQTLLKNKPSRFGTPESLRVILRELQCLCLDLQLYTPRRKVKVKQKI